MKIGEARQAAADWVHKYAGREEWFVGAYFSGSTVGRPDGEELSSASDIDVVVVISHDEAPMKPGKFIYRDALLEVTYLSRSELSSPEAVLASYHLAGSFRTDTIIADPTGQLRELQREVSRCFAERKWVRRRSEHVLQKIEHGLRSLDETAPLHDQATAWLFPTGVMAHAPLVAALRNPTVRLRYLAARGVLEEFGFADRYGELLELLGCAGMTPQRVRHHVDALARTFDAAARAARTPFFFSTDITPAARPIVIDGSIQLIRAGNHREAVFWIAATFARCHKILAADALPQAKEALVPAFEELLADLGAATAEARRRRAGEALRYLPRLRETAEAIASARP
ncbi:hypothetical protein [Paenibacillus ginsengihumi]|uniref:hypothetical protein n=1 Tax=Paenibacillus ginsengihumi TaxID=431596 RepID=UPI00035FDEDB|nr:hypothetical protein [Paenibacillus ginsengihumi]